jgi:hypothetical protein
MMPNMHVGVVAQLRDHDAALLVEDVVAAAAGQVDAMGVLAWAMAAMRARSPRLSATREAVDVAHSITRVRVLSV